MNIIIAFEIKKNLLQREELVNKSRVERSSTFDNSYKYSVNQELSTAHHNASNYFACIIGTSLIALK